MSIGRRRFLQGTVSAGAVLLAAPTALLADQSAAAGRSFLLLRSPDDEPFALPARQAALRLGVSSIASLVLTDKLVSTPGALRAALKAHRGATLVGLMDDFSAALLEETVRDVGGSVRCRGQHRGSLRGDAGSRHAFMTTATTRGIGSALADTLDAHAAAFVVREHALGEDGSALAQADSLPVAPWPTVLGDSYARMAVGLWSPRPVIAELQRGRVEDAPGSQPYVSLIATI